MISKTAEGKVIYHPDVPSLEQHPLFLILDVFPLPSRLHTPSPNCHQATSHTNTLTPTNTSTTS